MQLISRPVVFRAVSKEFCPSARRAAVKSFVSGGVREDECDRLAFHSSYLVEHLQVLK